MIDALSSFANWLYSLVSWCFDGIIVIFKLCLFLVFDGVLTVITGFFTALNFANVASSYICDWSGLPSQLGYVIGAIGMPSCLSLLVGAVSIRMLINLIPSWATRV